MKGQFTELCVRRKLISTNTALKDEQQKGRGVMEVGGSVKGTL